MRFSLRVQTDCFRPGVLWMHEGLSLNPSTHIAVRQVPGRRRQVIPSESLSESVKSRFSISKTKMGVVEENS